MLGGSLPMRPPNEKVSGLPEAAVLKGGDAPKRGRCTPRLVANNSYYVVKRTTHATHATRPY